MKQLCSLYATFVFLLVTPFKFLYWMTQFCKMKRFEIYINKTCLKNAAQDANVENREEVKAALKTFEDMCTAGTDLNKLYVEKRICVKNSLANHVKVIECIKELLQDVVNLTPQQQQDSKVMLKLSCKHADSVNSCFANHVEEQCGSEGLQFFNGIQDPSQKLLKQACIENNSFSGGHVSLQAAVAMVSGFSP